MSRIPSPKGEGGGQAQPARQNSTGPRSNRIRRAKWPPKDTIAASTELGNALRPRHRSKRRALRQQRLRERSLVGRPCSASGDRRASAPPQCRTRRRNNRPITPCPAGVSHWRGFDRERRLCCGSECCRLSARGSPLRGALVAVALGVTLASRAQLHARSDPARGGPHTLPRVGARVCPHDCLGSDCPRPSSRSHLLGPRAARRFGSPTTSTFSDAPAR
jgi:hypothetical protein